MYTYLLTNMHVGQMLPPPPPPPPRPYKQAWINELRQLFPQINFLKINVSAVIECYEIHDLEPILYDKMYVCIQNHLESD